MATLAILAKPAPVNKQLAEQLPAPSTATVEEEQAHPVKTEAKEIEKPKAKATPKQPERPVKVETPTQVHPVGCENYKNLVAQYDWHVPTALSVINAESTCNPSAVNNNPSTGDYSVGLFQINLYGANALTRPSEAELKNPATNIAWAYKLYSGNGGSFIGQWGVCRAKVSCY